MKIENLDEILSMAHQVVQVTEQILIEKSRQSAVTSDSYKNEIMDAQTLSNRLADMLTGVDDKDLAKLVWNVRTALQFSADSGYQPSKALMTRIRIMAIRRSVVRQISTLMMELEDLESYENWSDAQKEAERSQIERELGLMRSRLEGENHAD